MLSYFIPGLYCCEKSKNTVVAMWAENLFEGSFTFYFHKIFLKRSNTQEDNTAISNCNAVFLQKIFQHIVSRKVGQRKINCRVS